MSSNPPYLNSVQMNLIHTVLVDGGYDARVSSHAPVIFKDAAHFLIRLVQSGVASKDELADRLSARADYRSGMRPTHGL